MAKIKQKQLLMKSRISSNKFITKPPSNAVKKELSAFKQKSRDGYIKGKANLKKFKLSQTAENKLTNKSLNAGTGGWNKLHQSTKNEKANGIQGGNSEQKVKVYGSDKLSNSGTHTETFNYAVSTHGSGGTAKLSKMKGVSQSPDGVTVKQHKTSPSHLSPQSALPQSQADSSVADANIGKGAEKKHKKVPKKQHDGVSNWMSLCKTLNIDATARKTKSLKRPADDTKEGHVTAEPKRTRPDVWFDHVDKILIEPQLAQDKAEDGKSDASITLVKPDSFKGVTNCVAMDCEMVGVGPRGDESMLARVSIVNHYGVCLYDKFVLPREKVTDYRTFVSGVTEENLATGEEFTKVQKEVSDIIRDRILVGHAVHNDLKVLYLTHPHKMIRDTSQYKPFRELFSGRLPSLKKLTDKVLGVSVQEGQHSSVQDAQATMRLYTMHRQKWEKELKAKRKLDKRKKKKKKK